MVFFLILSSILVAFLLVEYLWHRSKRHRIPIRIHVNGIRGKSSVTRLIAAGLREAGFKTWAKVTGTRPTIIDEMGRELSISRFAGPRLSEQRAVICEAADRNVEALVLECMALQPINQQVSEDGIVRATVGVITNIRHDHLEVFGPSLDGIAQALAATVPRKGLLVTTPGPGLDILRAKAAARSTRLVTAGEHDVDDETTGLLPYSERRQNVALALKVCDELGVKRDVALRGMLRVQPDAGALGIIDVRRGAQLLHVVNALAANDPESTKAVFREQVAGRWDCPLFVVVNTRRDRPLRSLQLGALLAQLPAQRFFLYGNDTAGVRVAALDAGVPAGALHNGSRLQPKAFVEELFAQAPQEAVVFMTGNTGGRGLALVAELQTSDTTD